LNGRYIQYTTRNSAVLAIVNWANAVGPISASALVGNFATGVGKIDNQL